MLKNNYVMKSKMGFAGMLMALILMGDQVLAKSKKVVVEIYIGAVSKDGSGLMGVYWGGDCISGEGICIKPSAAYRNDDESLKNLIISKDLGFDLTISDPGQIEQLGRFCSENTITLKEGTNLSSEITNQFDFLVPNGKYFVEAGTYSIERVESAIILHLKIKR
jgi:hypothetical protein